MSHEDFLPQLYRHSSSKETGARIKSQYEADLKSEADCVGILGLYCCETFVGGITYAHKPMPYSPGAFSARLDTVLTLPKFRGMGLGKILMSGLFLHSIESLGDSLHRYSTIALHPAVGHFVEQLNFEGLQDSETPLYAIDLAESERRAEFARQARIAHRESMHAVTSRCMTCMKRKWSTPWCRPKDMKRSA